MGYEKPITKRAVDEILVDKYTEQGARGWWMRPRVGLGGITPNEAWLRGNHYQVLCLAKNS